MRRRLVLAAAVELTLLALMVGMHAFSIYMARRERDWRELGVKLGPVAQLAIDVSMWWLSYWWIVAPLILLGGLGLAGLILVTGGRPRYNPTEKPAGRPDR